MKSRESGQALALVLVLVAVGALLIAPALRLSYTSQLSSEMVRDETRIMYALDAGHEYIMWKLLYDEQWRSALQEGVPSNSDGNPLTDIAPLDVCGKEVTVSVAMQAVPGQGGIGLVDDNAFIRPQKTVSPTAVANGYTGPITYTIELEQISDTIGPLEAVYDILSKELKNQEASYVEGSTQVSLDGPDGPWVAMPDPDVETVPGGEWRLVWPASYEVVDGVDTNGFSDLDPLDVDWAGFGTFTERQVKHLRFQLDDLSLGTDTRILRVVAR